MIEHLEKLPDSMIGLLAAGSLWFGFNYAVLGERAFDRYGAEQVMPACMESLGTPGSGNSTKFGLGDLLGMPELNGLDELVERFKPRSLSAAEKFAKCECALAANAETMRLDFAISTSLFRAFSPASISGLRSRTVGVLTSGACGPLPGAGE